MLQTTELVRALGRLLSEGRQGEVSPVLLRAALHVFPVVEARVRLPQPTHVRLKSKASRAANDAPVIHDRNREMAPASTTVVCFAMAAAIQPDSAVVEILKFSFVRNCNCANVSRWDCMNLRIDCAYAFFATHFYFILYVTLSGDVIANEPKTIAPSRGIDHIRTIHVSMLYRIHQT